MQYRIHQSIVVEKQRHSKWWILGAVLTVMLIAIAIKFIAGPVNGHVTAVDQKIRTSSHPVVTLVPASTIDTPYFQLGLPIGYKLNASQPPNGNTLLTETIFKPSTDGTRIISITLMPEPDGGFTQLSGYRSRAQATDLYSLSSLHIEGDTLVSAIRRDGEAGEVTVFWPHGAYVATIAISTGLDAATDTASNQASIQTLLNKWQWK